MTCDSFLLYSTMRNILTNQTNMTQYHIMLRSRWTCSSGRVDLVEEKVKHSFYWLFFIIWLCYAWWFNFCLYVFYNSTLTWEISSIIDSTFSAGVLWYFVELRGGRGPGEDLLVVKLRSSQVNLPGLPTSLVTSYGWRGDYPRVGFSVRSHQSPWWSVVTGESVRKT